MSSEYEGTGLRGDVTISHFALTVSDLERSTRFYADGLGFEPVARFDIGGDLAHVAEVEPPMEVTVQVLQKGPTKLQLMCFTSPTATGQPAATRAQLGFTHLSVSVEDLAAVEARLAALLGTAIEQTREHSRFPGGTIDMLFMADPDGVRIELSPYTYR